MGYWKWVGIAAGGIAAIVAAPIIIPLAAAAGTAALGAAATAGTAAAAAAATATAVVAETAIGGAAIAALSTAGTAAATGATIAAETAIGTAVISAGATAGTAAAGAVTSAVGVLGPTGVAATIGAGATYSSLTAIEGFTNKIEADDKIKSAKNIYEISSERLKSAIIESNAKVDNLNHHKAEILANDIKNAISLFAKIIKTKETSSDFKDYGYDYYFDPNTTQNINIEINQAMEFLKAAASGASVATKSAAGAFAFLSQFGVV